MEQGLKLVDVGTLHKVRRAKLDPEPLWHRKLLVAIDSIVGLLIDGHVHTESGRVEVEHDELLAEAEATQGAMNHVVDLVIQRLFDVDRRRVYKHRVLSDLR